MPAYPLLLVNGVALNDPAERWGIAADQAFRTLPGRRAHSTAIPGKGGVSVPRRTVRDSSTFTISMLVLGNGQTQSARVADLQKNLDSVDFLFTNNGELFPVTYIAGPAATDVFVAQCRRVASSDPDRVGGGDAATVKFILEIPSGDWRDPAPIDTTLNWPFPGVSTLSSLRGGTNQITDHLFIMEGPFTQFSIFDPTSGQYLTFVPGGSIPKVNVNQFIRIDTATMKAGFFTNFSWTNLGSDCTSQIQNGGPGAGRSWLPLTPRMYNGDPAVRDVQLALSCNGANVAPGTGTPGTKLHIRAKRSF